VGIYVNCAGLKPAVWELKEGVRKTLGMWELKRISN
jgi:hypothetical protein